MKKIPFLFLFTLICFSCGKDEFSDDLLLDDTQELETSNRHSSAPGCSLTFLGYDDEGCCIYRFNQVSYPNEVTKEGKSKTYIMVNGAVIKSNIFTVCDAATVRMIRESNQTSMIVCSSYVECEQSCDIDVSIEDTDDAGDCCWTVTTSGITNHVLSIDGSEQALTSDVSKCICADEGETLEILVMDENGTVCFEDSVTCYECDDCDQNYLSVSMNPAPPEDGRTCCFVSIVKEGPFSICDSNGGSNWVYPQEGITITGIGGSPVSVGLKICRDEGAETTMTGFWDIHSDGETICPRMEIDFDLADCN